ncbi:MAG: uL15 family ribosomal protein [Candidatus Aenigmarchaeota archaeon]|jgi:large subunit ribosomal protein L15|nr:uL15 family ribosomal protein [Candidatus Aenigmarchaeota archaeon]
MVVRREKKRRRGERTYHGRHAKWRGGGSRGGRGNVSLHKHKMKWKEREKGFRYPLRKEKKTINLDELNELVKEMIEKKNVNVENLKISLRELGYQKLLGRGKIEFPVIIEVKEASENARRKVSEIGGKIVTE